MRGGNSGCSASRACRNAVRQGFVWSCRRYVELVLPAWGRRGKSNEANERLSSGNGSPSVVSGSPNRLQPCACADVNHRSANNSGNPLLGGVVRSNRGRTIAVMSWASSNSHWMPSSPSKRRTASPV